MSRLKNSYITTDRAAESKWSRVVALLWEAVPLVYFAVPGWPRRGPAQWHVSHPRTAQNRSYLVCSWTLWMFHRTHESSITTMKGQTHWRLTPSSSRRFLSSSRLWYDSSLMRNLAAPGRQHQKGSDVPLVGLAEAPQTRRILSTLMRIHLVTVHMGIDQTSRAVIPTHQCRQEASRKCLKCRFLEPTTRGSH